jgi:hypothetical protein
MYLVQILLPLNRNDGQRQPPELFGAVRDELVARFGGLTAYSRSPAVGLWTGAGERTDRDDVVIVEVMTDDLDHGWWDSFRRLLEDRFEQSAIVVRALPAVPL